MNDRSTRLERALRALGESDEMSPERTLEILRERARVLARAPTEPTTTADRLEIVTFRLGKERYGIEARFVLGVIRALGVTPVPGLPDLFFGVTNLRGEIIAVVDLGRVLSVDRAELGQHSRLIVLGLDRAEFALLVDDTDEVTSIDLGALHAPATILGAGRRPYLRGVTEDALIAIDAGALLSDERLFFDEADVAERRS